MIKLILYRDPGFSDFSNVWLGTKKGQDLDFYLDDYWIEPFEIIGEL